MALMMNLAALGAEIKDALHQPSDPGGAAESSGCASRFKYCIRVRSTPYSTMKSNIDYN
jgi:hypothetical protein